jgi:hypothetical protein
MAEKFARWDASNHLKTEEDITAYFEACHPAPLSRPLLRAGPPDGTIGPCT